MDGMRAESVDMVITSPPYNVGKEYDIDYTLDEYAGFLHAMSRAAYRVTAEGGRMAVNIAGVGPDGSCAAR